MIKVRHIFLLGIIFYSFLSEAQINNIGFKLLSLNKKAEKLWKTKAYIDAKEVYKRIIKKDSNNLDAKIKLAEIYKSLRNTEEAEYWYSKALQSRDTIQSFYKLHYAEVLLSNNKREEALKWFKIYHEENPEAAGIVEKVETLINYKNFFKDSVAYTIKSIGVNSNESDLAPLIFDKGILFLSSRPQEPFIERRYAYNESLLYKSFYAEFTNDTGFTKAVRYKDIQAPFLDGFMTFFENDTKVIFSKNIKPTNKNNHAAWDLFYSKKSTVDYKWESPCPLPFNQPGYSLTHPYFNSYTSTLYFVSDMPGGFGGTDIYKSTYHNSSWSKPENLGAGINTQGNEIFPFFYSDSLLYFSSDGLAGMGGQDIYIADMKDAFPRAENMGYPINTRYDDYAFIIDETHKKGLLCSNRKRGKEDDDLYLVNIHDILFNGIIKEKVRSIPLKNVLIRVKEVESGKWKKALKTDEYGKFYCTIKPGKHYSFEVKKSDYRFYNFEVYFPDRMDKVVRKIINLEKINRALIKGKISDEGIPFHQCLVTCTDYSSDYKETVYTDSSGYFECEVNPDTTTIFYIEKDGIKGICKMNPFNIKKTVKGVDYISLKFETIQTIPVHGILKDSSGTIIPNDTIYFKNYIDDSESYSITNDKGEFSIDLWKYGKYMALIHDKSKNVLLKTFIPEKDNILQLTKRNWDEIEDFSY